MTDERTDPGTTARDAIAAEVRAELARQHKTQRNIAEVLGLPQPSVHQRLHGRTSFRAEELTLIADYLGVPVERFMPAPIALLGGAA